MMRFTGPFSPSLMKTPVLAGNLFKLVDGAWRWRKARMVRAAIFLTI